MKVTRELIDNGQKIIHINYEPEDIEKIMNDMAEKTAKKEKADAQ